MCVSSCWALSGDLKSRAPHRTELIPDVRQVKGEERGETHNPQHTTHNSEIPLSPVTPPTPLLNQLPTPHLPKRPWPQAVPRIPAGPQKRVFISSPQLHCFPPSIFYLASWIFVTPNLSAILPLTLCLSGWMKGSVQKAARQRAAGWSWCAWGFEVGSGSKRCAAWFVCCNMTRNINRCCHCSSL